MMKKWGKEKERKEKEKAKREIKTGVNIAYLLGLNFYCRHFFSLLLIL